MRNLARVAAIALGMAASSVHADITVGVWTNFYGNTTLATPATGGNPNGNWLQVTFPATSSAPGPQWSDIIYTKATNVIAGTWTTNTAVQFDFWQSNSVAGGLALEFGNTNNSDIWSYSLTPQSGTNWTMFGVSFNDLANWSLPFSADTYLNDLAAIDWIGIYIYRDTTSQEVYGIDNVKLMVPEPAEYILLAAAMMMSGMSLCWRRRLKGEAVVEIDSA